ncbi:MAG: CCA tRNA nucleotidyltransferase [Propionibacterium sp.]
MLRINPLVEELASLFSDAGEQLYLVGGSVRDALLGRLGHDLDFTTSASPDRTEELLHKFSRAVWAIGKEFGTIGASRTVDGREWVVEITTFRADSYSPDSRKPVVAFGDNLHDDLIRRDFTVNAMAIDVINKGFIDPHGGLGDLSREVLRTPSPPEVSFSDDPLRMMRACRFAAQLGFSIDPASFRAMQEMHERISIISPERVRDELSKLLCSDTPRPGLNMLVDSGLADLVLPELPAMKLERDDHFRHKDVYEHSLTVLDQAIALEKGRDFKDGHPNPNHQPDLVIRLAALLHDIGKPATRGLEGNKVTFHHHDVVGARMAKRRLKALHFPNSVVDAVSQLIEQHLRFHGYGEAEWTDSAVRRYVRDAGDQLEHLHILTRSDCTTRNARKAERLRRAYDELEARIDELAAQEELKSIRPDLDGNQIMSILGVPPGPQVGKAYNYLLNLRMDRGPLGADEAEHELRAWWDQQGDKGSSH